MRGGGSQANTYDDKKYVALLENWRKIMSIKNVDLLNFEAVVKWSDEIAYAASCEYNALFKVFLSSRDAEYLQMFPDEKPNGVRLFTMALSYGEKIYFVPASASHIAVYEPDKNNLYNLQIEAVDQFKNPHFKINAKFNGGMVVGKYIYMTPCTYPGFIRINPDNDVIEYYNDWIGDGDYVFRKAPLLDENMIYIPSVINNKILRIDTDICKGQMISIGTKNGGWWSMCKQDGDYWLAPQMPGPIIRWNVEKNVIDEFDDYPDDFNGKDFYFTKIFSHGNQIVLLPGKANMGIVLDVESKEMHPLTLLGSNKLSLTGLRFEIDGYIYLSVMVGNVIKNIKLNTADLSIEGYAFKCTKNINRLNQDMQYGMMTNTGVKKETLLFDLSDFLMSLAKADFV